MRTLRPLFISLALIASAPAAVASTTTSFGLACYGNNSTACPAPGYASGLQLKVIDNQNGTVGFQFINNISPLFPGNSPDAARITTIFFDVAGISSMTPGAVVGTVAYAADGPNLGAPGGAGQTWPASATDFQFSPIRTGQGQGAVSAAANAIQTGESLIITGTFANFSNASYQNLIASFNSNTPPTGATRVAFHLQSIGANGGQSDHLYAVPSTTVVPVPGALPLMLGGLLGLGFFARRRKA